MFKDKLKKAMTDLNLNQVQVAGLTGKSKSSISQYLSGSQVPSPDAQMHMAIALGLKEDYFLESKGQDCQIPTAKTVKRMTVSEVARMLQMNASTVRKGLQQGVFPWGYGIKTQKNRWTYFINAKRFMDIEGIQV